MNNLPERLNRLEELAYNMWWAWHDGGRSVFRMVDYPVWRLTQHNPVLVLHQANPEKIRELAEDPSFLAVYDSALSALDTDVKTSSPWLQQNHPELLQNPVAYFSMEFAIQNSLPIYAGGLGILAGDICKEVSDMGQPMVGIGFMYPYGYFHQHIDQNGWQQETYPELNISYVPMKQVFSPDGKECITSIEMGGVELGLRVWLVKVGFTNIYLLDTNLKENPSHFREIVSQLYTAEPEHRLQQEIVLGIGGVRVLRALGYNPRVWHGNEGHTSFMMLERAREEMQQGMSFDEAVKSVQASTVFTTHTPVKAGHDTFPFHLIEKYFSKYLEAAGIDKEQFLRLGLSDGWDSQSFNMTAIALRMAGHRSAVSRLHGGVTRKMWHNLWPESSEEAVPISHITNGVHLPSWVAPTIGSLFEEYLSVSWPEKQDYPDFWQKIWEVPDERIWEVHMKLKRKLGTIIRDRMRSRWVEDKITLSQTMALGGLFDAEVLTIAFCRRFAQYKRPTLILQDIERLKKLVVNDWSPVQIVFSGKSHPADTSSKGLLQQVYNIAADPAFKGRIIFLEDYDMHIAHYLVQGVDVWLNNPRRLMEASGTSGMKAAVNGVINLSVRDGWWHEGYNGKNGWAIGGEHPLDNHHEEDRGDAESLYRLLEEAVVPMYYDQDRHGVPHQWVGKMKESISSILPAYSGRRMLKQYIQQMYEPINGSGQ
ncbi:alpha-glucan family phosphorylase [Chloroflexota bacterium]